MKKKAARKIIPTLQYLITIDKDLRSVKMSLV